MGGANTLGQHDCFAVGCRTVVSASLVMCVYHWFKVPAELRRDVTDAYTTWRKFHSDSTRQRFEELRQEAVDAVEEAKRRTYPASG